MRAVLQVLLLRVGVDRRHEAVLDAGQVVEDLGEGREGVGRAGRVRDDRVQLRVVRVGVDAVRERDIGTVGGGADEHALGTGVDVGAGGLGVGEAAGRLEDDLHAELGPGKLRRLALGEHLDAVAVDDEGVAVDAHRTAEATRGRVEGEQSREGGRLRQVVHGHDLEVGVALEQCAQHVASDAAESVDGDASHEWCPFNFCVATRFARRERS